MFVYDLLIPTSTAVWCQFAFCMNFNHCLSLSHSLLLVQYCVSPYHFWYLKLLPVVMQHYSLFVFLFPLPIQWHPLLNHTVLHCSLLCLLSLTSSQLSIFVCRHLLNTAFIPLSHPFISPKGRSFASKRMSTGWNSPVHWPCPAGSHVCSVWSWFLSMVLCSWLSTLCFLWLTFAQMSSWIKTSSSGMTKWNERHHYPDCISDGWQSCGHHTKVFLTCLINVT